MYFIEFYILFFCFIFAFCNCEEHDFPIVGGEGKLIVHAKHFIFLHEIVDEVLGVSECPGVGESKIMFGGIRKQMFEGDFIAFFWFSLHLLELLR